MKTCSKHPNYQFREDANKRGVCPLCEAAEITRFGIGGAAIFAAFAKWINQRPGLEPGNYDRNGYRSEALRIAKDGREARAALKAAQYFPFDPAAMQDALDRAFSGRLEWHGEGWRVTCLSDTNDDGSKGPRVEATRKRFDSEAAARKYAATIAKDRYALVHSGGFEYCTGQYWPTEYRIAARAVLDRYVETVRPKTLPHGKIPRSVQEIKAANHAAGGHYFDRNTMRFFRSRVVPGVHVGPGGVFFVTSEQFVDSHGNSQPRKFSVREFDPQTGDINGSLDEFTKAEAKAEAKARAAGKQVAA